MENNNLKNIDDFSEKHRLSENCEHEWEYMVYSIKKDNVFVEVCLKCLKSIKTYEMSNEKK